MKLVEILAKELDVWPDKASHAVQHINGDVGFTYDGKPGRMSNDWSINAKSASRKSYWLIGAATSVSKTASDHATAIVTRADWEKEKMKQAAPKKNAEGWVRHRGGKCPVEKGTRVDVRYRNGDVVNGVLALDWRSDAHQCGWSANTEFWKKDNVSADIMAYRLHKPAEQPEPFIEAVQEFNALAKVPQLDGPTGWRDRIAEIDATTQSLAAERADLVQKLASEGFALIGRAVDPVEDMSDWKNWKDGDFLECVTIPEDHKGYYSTGNAYELAVNDISDDKYPVSVMSERGISLWCSADCFKFSHRIPSA